MQHNGHPFIECTPTSALDSLKDAPRKFSLFYPDHPLEARPVPEIDDFVALIGVCIVPAEVTADFMATAMASNSYVSHQQYASMAQGAQRYANRVTLLHPPKPLRGVSGRSRDKVVHVQNTVIRPLQAAGRSRRAFEAQQKSPTGMIARYIREQYLLKPTRSTVDTNPHHRRHTLEDRHDIKLVGGWGVFQVGRQTVAAAFLANRLISDSKVAIENMTGHHSWNHNEISAHVRDRQQAGVSFPHLVHEMGLRVIAAESPSLAATRQLMETRFLRVLSGMAEEAITTSAPRQIPAEVA